MEEKIEIRLSKRKLTILFIGSIAFVAIGVWFVIGSPKIRHGIIINQTLLVVIGVVSILFFGVCALMIFRKFQDKKPGLIIDKTGLTDNASGISAGHIPWSDITEIKISQVMSQKFFMICVTDPQKYIARQTNILKRKTAEMNYKHYGSPISISANSLVCTFEELESTLLKQFHEHRKFLSPRPHQNPSHDL